MKATPSNIKISRPAKNQPISAVTLLTHGFNLRPARLADIADTLLPLGHIVVNLTLTGHDGDYANLSSVTRDIWLEDMQRATLKALNLSIEHGAPLNFVGISLGALLNVDMLNHTKDNGEAPLFNKRVLLVPALRLRWYSHLLRCLNFLPWVKNISSRSPVAFRVHDQLPLAAYNAAFASAAATTELNTLNLSIPTLVFAAPKDELVSFSGLAQIIARYPSAPWTLVPLDNSESNVSPHFAHNCVDSESMGHSCWSKFKLELIRFLESA